MTNIFFLFEETISFNYGIGRYCECVLGLVGNSNNLKLTIIVLRSKYSDFKFDSINGIDYYYVPNILNDELYESNKDIYQRHLWYLIYPNLIRRNKMPNCILHINNWGYSAIIDLFKIYFPKGKICFTIHFFDWCFEYDGNISLFKKHLLDGSVSNRIYIRYMKELDMIEKVDKIIVLSDRSKLLVEEVYKVSPQKICVINNGLKRKRKKEVDRIQIGFSKNDIIITYVGRLEKTKGLDFVIEGFKLACKANENLKLVVVGDGDISQYIKTIYPLYQKIIFTGWLEEEKLYDIYGITDIGILLSYHEQCSYAIIEMLMLGIPMVVSNAIGINEMIQNGYNGLVVPISFSTGEPNIDINLVSESILKLANDENLRKDFSKNSMELFMQKYTIENMKDQITSLYRSLRSTDDYNKIC